jgi:putative addiction module component (TIGR02574 family)
MANPIFDFSHLSPEERIQLAQDLWDSLSPNALPLTPTQIAELRSRRAAYDRSTDPGRPWTQALDEIERGG